MCRPTGLHAAGQSDRHHRGHDHACGGLDHGHRAAHHSASHCRIIRQGYAQDDALVCNLSVIFSFTGLLLSFYLNLTSGATIILIAGVAYLISFAVKSKQTSTRKLGLKKFPFLVSNTPLPRREREGEVELHDKAHDFRGFLQTSSKCL